MNVTNLNINDRAVEEIVRQQKAPVKYQGL
jgi:hypothetical protein